MPLAETDAVQLHYETFGDPSASPLVLVAGLGAHSISWSDELCGDLASRGHHVVRFDNRDIGLSTHLGEGAAYTLSDMAGDTVGLLDALGLERVHLVGRSMGGMIAQTVAIQHPERVRTLVSIMSNTGEVDYGQPEPEMLTALLAMGQPAASADAAVEAAVELARTLGSPGMFDEPFARQVAEEMARRNPDPAAVGRQMLAVVTSGSREEGLRALVIPTLVIHGDADRLVAPSGGRRTAELVPGAAYVEIEGMAHDMPRLLWTRYVDLITDFVATATGA
ncbi:MAG TPA: alpha/beta hydrolase [Microthrixaceae bacterium]|nr:alpha/beta hydrolase [Microthrixaceae bacterium]